MKKLILSIFACLVAMASFTFGANETVLFNDNNGVATAGTYAANASFSLDVSASWTGYTAVGLSYWIEVPTALAPFIKITSENYFTWSDPNASAIGGGGVPFNSSTDADSGNMLAPRDMGATSAQDFSQPPQFTEVKSAGTYQVSSLGFSLTGAPAGTYVLRTTSIGGHASEITDGTAAASGAQHFLVNQGTYTITVVPEPATWSLLGLGGLGSLGLTCLRRRRA